MLPSLVIPKNHFLYFLENSVSQLDTISHVQKGFFQEFAEGLGLGYLWSSRSNNASCASDACINQRDSQPQRPPPTSRSFSEQLAIRDETEKPLHVFTDVRRNSVKNG